MFHMLRFLAGILCVTVMAGLAPLEMVGAAAASPTTLFPEEVSTEVVPLDWDIASGGHFFTQTGGTANKGFAVTDADGIGFWQEYRRHGGVQVLGYPVSRRFEWQGFMNQAFQRAILQWHPDQQRALPLNLLDLLHLAGKDDWLLTVRSVPPPVDAASFDAGKDWPQIVAGRLGLLDPSPAIKAWYESARDSFNLYGLPTSPVMDAGPLYVVRFQRAVVQQWKVDVPWAKAGQITVGLAGDLAREAGLFDLPGVWDPEDVQDKGPRWGWQVASVAIPPGERWIDIQLSAQTITAMVGDQPVYRAPVTSGKRAFGTPHGNYHIFRRVYNETMDSATVGIPRNSPDGYYLENVYFTQYFAAGGYAIHANYWMPDDVFGAQPTSHGCVGMRYDDARFFWDFATVGTRVTIRQ